MLVKLSFEHEVCFGSGSGAQYIDVNGVEFIQLSSKEFHRLEYLSDLHILKYGFGYEEDEKATVNLEIISDPDLIQRISGIEKLVSTYNIYEHIIEGEYYHQTFILMETKIKKKLSKVLEKNLSLDETFKKLAKIRCQINRKIYPDEIKFIEHIFIQKINSTESLNFNNKHFNYIINIIETWTPDLAIFISKVAQDDFERIYSNNLERLICEYPQYCHPVMLIDLEDYAKIPKYLDLLISHGRNINEKDDWSEERHILAYLDIFKSIYEKYMNQITDDIKDEIKEDVMDKYLNIIK